MTNTLPLCYSVFSNLFIYSFIYFLFTVDKFATKRRYNTVY